MGKFFSLFFIFCFMFSLTACKSSNSETILTDNKTIEVSENNISDALREYSLKLSDYSTNLGSFRAVGNAKDKEQSDYIKSVFEDIGLKNVRQESVILDGWNTEGIMFSFVCDCDDVNQNLTISQIGIYPSNFSYENTICNLYNVGTGVKADYDDLATDVSNSGVLFINSSSNIKDCIDLAISRNAAFVIYTLSDETNPTKYSIDLNFYSATEIPVFVISRGNYNLLKKSVEIGRNIDIVLNGFSTITNNIESDFIFGEIEGNTTEKIYVTANRDSITPGFMSSSVSVSELFLIAENLVDINKKPNYTVCFMVTTGQEWGKVGKTYNEGLFTYLKDKDLENINSVLVLDGSKPIKNTILFDTQVGYEDKLKEIEDYNSVYFKNKNLSFLNVINTTNSFRNTEAIIWESLDIPYILQAEAVNSGYLDIENSNLDVASLNISEEHSKFLIDYYVGLLKLFSY